ncbi:MFS transporter [Lederbergia lenta]|uniref:Major facilitator family transporter n=1 Tax=Lederbergia lenta TaxID=1467 RepID=A0A2X4W3S9_LEDLE|nr:MFS transporter [Lederbergia lenta]MEC2325894.1 MFS transporter [Lederbergia lenta]SQI53582.1 major facilitator family transporter [Lederbergia lenta]
MAKQKKLLVFILTIGVFGILNTEMGVIGILPEIAEHFNVSVSAAGWLVSIFAIGVAVSGPTMPLMFSRFDRKKVMVFVLSVFVVANIVSIFTTSFTILLIARIIPALCHPIYCSLAFSVAADSVSKEEAPKAVANVFIGVSAGMVVGVPIVSFIAGVSNLQMAMAFFAIVNIAVLIATFLFVPSMPVKEKISYGTQLNVLKHSNTWLAIIIVVLINAAVYSVYSYLAEFLQTVTNVSSNITSLILFIYGAANIIGNILAGRLLIVKPVKTIVALPFLMGAVYILLFFAGQFTLPMALITLIWGILAGLAANINQYVVTTAASEAPDFANGLFLSACNIGTTIGAGVGGLFISELGTQYVVLVGILSLILTAVFIFLRNYHLRTAELVSK